MATEVLVHADLHGEPVLVGRLFAHASGNRESATFEYDDAWLAHDERFALEPGLQLTQGAFHTGGDKPLFGAIGEDDSSASLELALSVAGYFDLTQKEAKAIAVEVGQAASQWRTVAAEFGIARAELERMHSAFEHRVAGRGVGRVSVLRGLP